MMTAYTERADKEEEEEAIRILDAWYVFVLYILACLIKILEGLFQRKRILIRLRKICLLQKCGPRISCLVRIHDKTI